MINFEAALESAITEFTNNRQSFTSWDVKEKIRDLYNLCARYRETNHSTLTFMQRGVSLNYVAKPIEILTGLNDRNGNPETAQVWQFTPLEDLSQDTSKSSKSGGFFSRLFHKH